MMFTHDGKSLMMDDRQLTDQDLANARYTVENFFSGDPDTSLQILQMLGIEEYERVETQMHNGKTQRLKI